MNDNDKGVDAIDLRDCGLYNKVLTLILSKISIIIM